MKCIKPTDERLVKHKEIFSSNRIEATMKIINKGLLSGNESFNDVLDKLPCTLDELEYVAVLYRNEGWNVKVVEDNCQTNTIILKNNLPLTR